MDDLIERAAREIMLARNGEAGCDVVDWPREARDNPHVAQALNQAKAALAAIRPGDELPNGLVAVPKKPTYAMLAIGQAHMPNGCLLASAYRAMLAVCQRERAMDELVETTEGLGLYKE